MSNSIGGSVAKIDDDEGESAEAGEPLGRGSEVHSSQMDRGGEDFVGAAWATRSRCVRIGASSSSGP